MANPEYWQLTHWRHPISTTTANGPITCVSAILLLRNVNSISSTSPSRTCAVGLLNPSEGIYVCSYDFHLFRFSPFLPALTISFESRLSNIYSPSLPAFVIPLKFWEVMSHLYPL